MQKMKKFVAKTEDRRHQVQKAEYRSMKKNEDVGREQDEQQIK
jgi:hypothetical protein